MQLQLTKTLSKKAQRSVLSQGRTQHISKEGVKNLDPALRSGSRNFGGGGVEILN